MWICETCGEIFDDPLIKTHRGNGVGCYREPDDTVPYCPDCKSEEVSPAAMCPICGRVYPDGEKFCDTCLEKMNAFASAARKKADELYLEQITDYAKGNAAALEYMEEIAS